MGNKGAEDRELPWASCENRGIMPSGMLAMKLKVRGAAAKWSGGRRCQDPKTKATALETIFKLDFYTCIAEDLSI